MRRAVFLDRDGTVNRAEIRAGRSYPPATTEEFCLLPGADEAIASLRAGGYVVVVVTNQPDVATGVQTRFTVEAMHDRLRDLTAVDDIRVCYHVDADGCACRKPRPGMLLEAARAWGVDLRESWMVGDRWRDVEAGLAAGCRTVWIRTALDERAATGHHVEVDSLLEASRVILSSAQEHHA